MTSTAASVCPECGTPATLRFPSPLPWSDWRRWAMAGLALVYVVGALVWFGQQQRTIPAVSAPVPMPVATMARFLEDGGGKGVSVGDLRRISQETSRGDLLARAVLFHDSFYYSGHIERRGTLAVATSSPQGMVGEGWSAGWPWAWVSSSRMVNYGDVLARKGRPEGPDTMPPSRLVHLTGVMSTRYPAWGWESRTFDALPIASCLICVWGVGLLADLCVRGFGWAAPGKRTAAKRLRGRVVRMAQLAAALVVAVILVASIKHPPSAAYAAATAPPVATPLGLAEMKALRGPGADSKLAVSLLAALGPDCKESDCVLTCFMSPDAWYLSQRPMTYLPFVMLGEYTSPNPAAVPGGCAGQWQWMFWVVLPHGDRATSAHVVTVMLDSMTRWVAPLWLLLGVVPGIVGFARRSTAARRVRRGCCVVCNYELRGTGA